MNAIVQNVNIMQAIDSFAKTYQARARRIAP
jgi:hypothetical protein